VEQVDNLPCQHAGAADAEQVFAFAIKQRNNDGIAFEKDLGGSEFRQQLVDGIVKVQAEIGSGVHALFHERTRQARRIPYIGLEDDVMQHTILRGLLFLGRQELVEHAIERGKFANPAVGDQVDTVKPRADGLEAAQVTVITEQVTQKASGKPAPLRAPAGRHPPNRGKQAIR